MPTGAPSPSTHESTPEARAPRREVVTAGPASRRGRGLVQPPPANEHPVLELQRLVGNRATTRLIERTTKAADAPRSARPDAAEAHPDVIQRDLFSWLAKKFGRKPKKGNVKTKVTDSKQDTESVETVEAPKTPKSVPEHPPEGESRLTLAGGQKILKGAFGTVKDFVPGKIEILDTAGFKTAYDAIYGGGQYSWDAYVVPTYGGLNGFAHDGTNYINSDSAGLHTVVHEMLHNNVASDWTAVVGSRWNEGATEILTQVACALVNEPAPVCYPGESPVVQEAINQGLHIADLQDAYLKGGAQEKIADWADKTCTQNWAYIKGKMEAKDWSAAKAGLQKKTT